jgi:hypothetical protein
LYKYIESTNKATVGSGYIAKIQATIGGSTRTVYKLVYISANAALAVVDANVDAILTDTGTTLDGKLDTIDGIVDDILVDTAEIGVAGAGLTDLGGMSTGMKAEVESEANDALVALRLDHLIAVADSDDPVNNSIIAKIAAGDGDWSGYDPVYDALEAISDGINDGVLSILGGQSSTFTNSGLVFQTTTIATLASQTSFTLTTGSPDDDAYNGCIIVIRDYTTPTSICFAKVLDYIGSSKTVTLETDPGIFTFGVGDRACILSPAAVAVMADGVIKNATLDSDLDTYQAKVKFVDDNSGTTDRYTVAWYKNGEHVNVGITNAKIQVQKISDGTDLIAQTAMTEIDSSGRFKYDATGAERIVDGAGYWAIATATINGYTRTWPEFTARDSSS